MKALVSIQISGTCGLSSCARLTRAQILTKKPIDVGVRRHIGERSEAALRPLILKYRSIPSSNRSISALGV
jgi:hypothetical protein